MNNSVIKQGGRFIALLLLQLFIFNNINFLGYINPFIYIIFILIYPIQSSRTVCIAVSFLLGLICDIFMDSGGVHATACLCLAYARPLFLRFSFKTMYEHQNIKFSSIAIGNLLGYVGLGVVFHHLILFSLEVFTISKILLILENTLFSGIFTLILSVIFILLFESRK